ncbi:MAG TPA: iron-sulfur cluster assembly protein, partial [Anaerolineales bacterium]
MRLPRLLRGFAMTYRKKIMTSKLTKESILAALSKVQEPELHQDLVTLNMIRNLEIESDK